MRRYLLMNSLFLLFVGMLVSSVSHAQQDKSKRASPPDSVTGKVAGATISINYSSPSVKGRKIWGDLVPYGQIWRAGANEATIFETNKAITVEGKRLPAGKYSLFAIPNQNEWTIIFNSQTGQWGIKRTGEANLDRAHDALTVMVKPRKSNTFHERLQYKIDSHGFSLLWENLEVPVSIR